MKRILVLGSDPQLSQRILHLFQDASGTYGVHQVNESQDGLHQLRAWKPHALIFHSREESINLNMISKLRSASSEEYAAILVISAAEAIGESAKEICKAIDLGADIYLPATFSDGELWVAIHSLMKIKEARDSVKRLNHRIEELGSIDDLTGVMNMRALYNCGEEEIAKARRAGRTVAAALFNIDGFSALNQSYGFMAGSQILQNLARMICENCAEHDLVGRLGADEFFVIFPGSDTQTARRKVDQIKERVQSVPFKGDRYSIKLTLTAGIAQLTLDQPQQKMSDLLHITAEALRFAKLEGPNHVYVY